MIETWIDRNTKKRRRGGERKERDMYSERMLYIDRERVRDRFTKTEIFWKRSYFGYLDILCVCVCVCVCVA